MIKNKTLGILITCLLSMTGTVESIELGSLDASFSQDGVSDGWEVIGDVGFQRDGADVAVDSMGRILVVGAYHYDNMGQTALGVYVERRLPDGSLDSSFGGNGIKTMPVAPHVIYQYDFAMTMSHNDGVFVAYTVDTCSQVNMCQADLIIFHLSSNGSILGQQQVAFNLSNDISRQNDRLKGLAYQASNQKLAVAAEVELSGISDTDYGIAVINVNQGTGELSMDTSFSNDGKSSCFFDHASSNGSIDSADAIAWVPGSGNVIIGGSTFEGNGGDNDGWNMSFCEFDSLGLAVTKWSTETLPDVLDDIEILRDMTVTVINNQPHVVAVGSLPGAGGTDFGLARFTINQQGSWQLDSSFGSNGNGFESTPFQMLFVGDTEDTARGLVIEEDGAILVMGGMYWVDLNQHANAAIALARYTQNGILDSNWGIGHTGTAVHSLNQVEVYDNPNAVAIDPNNEEIYVVGQSFTGSDFHTLIVNMHNDLIMGSNFDF